MEKKQYPLPTLRAHIEIRNTTPTGIIKILRREMLPSSYLKGRFLDLSISDGICQAAIIRPTSQTYVYYPTGSLLQALAIPLLFLSLPQ